AQWPFEGGMLRLEPTELHMAVAEPRRFTLAIEGLDAGRFLQHMNMSNLAATGTFDGRLPLVLDANGGRSTGGTLVSRAPGG
ncbi:YdbH domain-containing protein, partial [Klebsiella pneumoniae]|uniref:intermembrane phospholipid transport protein YdbH family protein n=1 Tax=Klebsiella pneumoniae TaxID=573 RepID=UPI003851CDE9